MLTLLIVGIVAIILGLIVLIWPRSLNIAVALWLMIWGVLQVLGYLKIIPVTGFIIG